MLETSLEMPVSSAASMLVGMVATEEQVPKETAAGLNSLLNMTFTAPLPLLIDILSCDGVHEIDHNLHIASQTEVVASGKDSARKKSRESNGKE